MRAGDTILAPVAKKKPTPEPAPNSGSTTPKKSGQQLNVRLPLELVEQFDLACSRLVPEITQTAALKMFLTAFVRDPEGFITAVKRFTAERDNPASD